MKWLKIGIFLAVLFSVAKAAPFPIADDDDTLRLPKSSVPISYDLALTTNIHLAQGSFSGVVKIEIQVVETTSVITVHNRGLAIDSVTLTRNGAATEVEFDQETEKEFLHIRSQALPLQVGAFYVIEIRFNGQLQQGTSGFYGSSYKVDTQTRSV